MGRLERMDQFLRCSGAGRKRVNRRLGGSSRGVLCGRTMSLLDSWLQPLRAYPRGFVLVAFVLTAGGLIWLIAKVLKWSVYSVALVTFAGVTGVFALWLWA